MNAQGNGSNAFAVLLRLDCRKSWIQTSDDLKQNTNIF